MKVRSAVPILFAVAGLAFGAAQAGAQAASGAGATTPPAASPSNPAAQAQPSGQYERPSEGRKLHTYLFDAFGPYAILGAAFGGAIQQGTNSPPEWGQGMQGYGYRVGSTFGIELVTTTSRYALAEIFREDTAYYRCECTGFFPRLGHAVISTVTARRGEDGHRVFSFPALAAPYAGSETAALTWYPGRFNAMDGFRMGNFNLAGEAGKNVALEFVWGGPHTLWGKMRHKN
jgi:hypothetical protein